MTTVNTISVLAVMILAGTSVVHGQVIDRDTTVDEIVVTSQRRPQHLLRLDSNAARLNAHQIDAIKPQHAHQLFTRVAGTWISRGSGQESLLAIRSPVLTGPGSCGSVLMLEDGIPIRPAGFCNVNQLFELDFEQARAVEVIRGPGSVLYGSNAMHGTINVLMPMPGVQADETASLELGANDYFRVRGDLPFAPGTPVRLTAVVAHDGGFRESTGFDQAKAHAKIRSNMFGGELMTALSVTDLRQQTAGFILGQDAYKISGLNRSNPNPEAFRHADSQRLYAIWRRKLGGARLDIRPYLRRSRMTFLQHFLPGQPLEENGQLSAGTLFIARFDHTAVDLTTGIDLEWSDTFLKETQDRPTEGSAFLQATRPAGKHYDYRTQSLNLATYLQAEFALGTNLSLTAGLRAELMHYAYDNRMLDGNTTDDGTPCGFGGCLYTRPADRDDTFTNVAPRVAVNYRLGDSVAMRASLGRGFRAPQMTELYRLQSDQSVADLNSERIDSVEMGLRARFARWSIDASVFAMRKRDSVLRDAEGFNVSNGRSRHTGIELALDGTLHAQLRYAVNASYARHRYDFNQLAARGEMFQQGNDVDTAPRWLASTELFYEPTDKLQFNLQWTMIGKYFLDAENNFTYPGHRLWNLRASYALNRRMLARLRLNNIADTDIADRADYAFGDYRYFPGRGRELFVELTYRHPDR